MMRRILRLGESRPLFFRRDKSDGGWFSPADALPLPGMRVNGKCIRPFFSQKDSGSSEVIHAAVIRLNDIIDKVASYSDIGNEDLDFIKKGLRVFGQGYIPARKEFRENRT